jgi:hypothetical protein
LVHSNDTEQTTGATSYTKKKETRLNRSLQGIRIGFGLKRNVGGVAKAKIYKNGIAIGTERTNSATPVGNYQTWTEDFTGFSAGDLVQIYCYTDNGANTISVANFRFYYDESEYTSVT